VKPVWHQMASVQNLQPLQKLDNPH